MENKTDFLEHGNLKTLFWKLAIPAIVSQVIVLIYNMVDRIFVGHIPQVGGLAITGLGLCAPIATILNAFSQLICVGGGPMLSFALGEKKTKDAQDIVGSSLLVLIVTGIILTFVTRIYAKPLLYLFGASDVTYAYAYDYLKWYALGTISVLISVGMAVYITAQGATKVAMFTVGTGAVINIIIDPIFIWYLKMGIEGAAIATVISQTISAVLVLLYLTGQKTAVRMTLGNLKIRPKMMLRSMALGLSPFIMQITESGVSLAFNRSLLRYGGDVAVGAMTLFVTINYIVFLPVSGMCQGAQPITSYNYGAGRYDRVAENCKRLICYSLVFTTIMWALIMFMPGMFLKMFTSDPAIFDYAIAHIRYFFPHIFLIALQPACQMSFLALKNAKVSLLLALLRKIVLLIPLIYIMPMLLPVKDTAVFLAEPVADVLAVLITTISFFTVNKELMKS